MSNAVVFPFLGAATVMACVFGSYAIAGGHIEVIAEGLPVNLIVIVLGAAAAVSIRTAIGGPSILKSIGLSLRGRGFRKADYRNLAAVLFHALNETGRGDVLPPDEAAAVMITDAKALLAGDQVGADQLGAILKTRIDVISATQLRAVHVLRSFGRALLWFGGVSALLGITHTLTAARAPEVVSGMFGSAITGLIVGIMVAIGFVQPLANRLEAAITDDANFYGFIRTAFFCRRAGIDPATAVRVASGALPEELKLGPDDMADVTLPSHTG